MMIKKSFWLFICLFFILPYFSIANEKIKEAQKILSEMGYEVLNNGQLDDLTITAIKNNTS